MLVQLNKCVVCGSNLQRGHSGDGVCLRRFCLNMIVGEDIVCSELGQRCSGECCFGVMYCELLTMMV